MSAEDKAREGFGVLAELWFLGASLWILSTLYPVTSAAYRVEALGLAAPSALFIGVLLLSTRLHVPFVGGLLMLAVALGGGIWAVDWWNGRTVGVKPIWVATPYYVLWFLAFASSRGQSPRLPSSRTAPPDSLRRTGD